MQRTPTRTWRAHLLLTTLAVLCLPAHARPFGAELTGEEILVEAEKLSPGDGTAGIWAISGDAEPKLLIPLGRYPRWSPDHTKFGFMRGKELWAADRVDGVSLQLDLTGSYTPVPCYGPGPYADPPFVWTPDGAHIAAWSVGPGGSGLGTLSAMSSSGRGGGLVYGSGRVNVGRATTSSDGSLVCYEAYRLLPDLGPVDREVRLYQVEGRTHTPITIDGLEHIALANPLWRPGSSVVAMDYFTEDRGRGIVLYDTETEEWQTLAPPSDKINWMRGAEWTPDGDRLLLIGAQCEGWYERLPYIAEFTPGEEPTLTPIGRRTWYEVYMTALSPDGSKVAMLCGDTPYIHSEDIRTLAVFSLDDPDARPEYHGPPAPGLQILRIDW